MITIGFLVPNITVSEGDGSFMACIIKDHDTVVEFNVSITSIGEAAGTVPCIVVYIIVILYHIHRYLQI